MGAEAAAGVIGVFTVQSCQTCQSGVYSYHANGKGLNRRQGLIVISDSQGPDISVLNSSLVGYPKKPMPLRFKGAWRFNPPKDGQFVNQSIPHSAVEECLELIRRATTQGDRQDVFEHFKGYFCTACGSAYARSSSTGWAEADLQTYASEAAGNAPLFIEAFYDACQSFSGDDPDKWAPDAAMINGILAKHRIGYEIRPPRLEPREDTASADVVEVVEPPPTLAQRAVDILQTSLSRSEELLIEGRGREAVQESLWLIETVATAFRGVDTGTGTIGGTYFNKIVNELRAANAGTTLQRVLDWIKALHGYLSAPAGGGVRHGLDLDEGVIISDNEARLFCNLIRSYLSFLLVEHEHLTREQ